MIIAKECSYLIVFASHFCHLAIILCGLLGNVSCGLARRLDVKGA